MSSEEIRTINQELRHLRIVRKGALREMRRLMNRKRELTEAAHSLLVERRNG